MVRTCSPNRLLFAIVICLWVWQPTASRAALLISGYDPQQHDRFADSANFIGYEFDFSGVGRLADNSGGGIGPWATMISPLHFLSATHHHPTGHSTLQFYETNSVTGGSIERTVVSGQRILQTDLWLGMIDEPLTSEIAYYDFFTGNQNQLVGSEILVVGQPSGGSGQSVGRNVIDASAWAFSSLSLGSSITTIFAYDYDPNHETRGQGSDEARVVLGDSGAPSFIVGQDGELQLAGIHWFTYPAENGMPPGSGDSWVGAYSAAINPIVSAQLAAYYGVPEPTSMAILAIGTTGIAVHRCRRYRRRREIIGR